MHMFCYQCQETGNRKGCTTTGICGKSDETANLQDLLIFCLKGLAFFAHQLSDENAKRQSGILATECLYSTITNTNFDSQRMVIYIKEVLEHRSKIKKLMNKTISPHNTIWISETENALWEAKSDQDIYKKSLIVGVLNVVDSDERSLKETIIYGLKGISAYAYHASVLGYFNNDIYDFIFEALYKTSIKISLDELMELVFKTGEFTIITMELLDKANSEVYGVPQPVLVKTGIGEKPGILVTGHELKDLELLLEQSQNQGIDIYTNGEMILAQSLPYFKRYPHLKGNYGNAWWQQTTEFLRFNGAILVTSNCIVPPLKEYTDRIFTTSVAGYPGVKHIEEINGRKDFSDIISLAKTCNPPVDLGEPNFMTGFNHRYLISISDKIVEAIKQGKIKKFIVMAGCDGRDQNRSYYTQKALTLPQDNIILTAGCAKYRYIKKVSGDIDGIPRVIDAGQCSDSFTIIAFAMHLMKVFDKSSINELPVEFDIAWYDQKAIAILLALIKLGVNKIKIGPTLPEYINQYLIKKISAKVEISTVYND